MRKLILTNNPAVIEEIEGRSGWETCTDYKLYEELIELCERLLLEGWHFASDPMGGYHFRPNPYHTIFLVKDAPFYKSWIQSQEWNMLDSIKTEYDRHKPFLKKYKEAQHEKDYQALDYSVAMRSLQSMEDRMDS